jgi:predicted DsbA family dithiol-disulfide isomerase
MIRRVDAPHRKRSSIGVRNDEISSFFRRTPALWHDCHMSESFVVDVWSDVVCPFCYLGHKQLSAALEQFEHHDDVVLRHRAFELDPNAPADYNLTLDELLAKKYAMSLERARSLNAKLESDASDLGMQWVMSDARPTNTFDAHRLIALAVTQELGGAMSERLFHAYFSEGKLLSNRSTLSTLGDEVGVRGIDELWESERFTSEVRDDETQATERGISGVPTFLVDEKFLVVGAQGSQQILDVLNRAWDRR